MSKTKVKIEDGSDDEFQDALNDAGTTTNKTAGIEELIQKQSELNLPDGTESENDEASATDSNVQPEELDDDIDEEVLLEREKHLSAEELQQNKEKANELKLEGNELFKNDKAEQAIEVYTEALRICPTANTKERAILYANRGAAKIKLDSRKSAIHDCTKAIELWPEYVRALLRRAKLFELEEKLDEALSDYQKVNELDPGQRDSLEALVRLPPLIHERNERMKAEMFSKLKDLGNMVLRPFGLSTNNFQMQQDPNTGSYSINFNNK